MDARGRALPTLTTSVISSVCFTLLADKYGRFITVNPPLDRFSDGRGRSNNVLCLKVDNLVLSAARRERMSLDVLFGNRRVQSKIWIFPSCASREAEL